MALPPSEAVTVAVCGLWGHEEYARRLLAQPGVRLVAIAGYEDLSSEVADRLTRLRAEHDAPHYPTPLALLRHHRPDLALVMVPPALNATLAATFLCAGCHVVSEKPLAQTSQTAGYLANATLVADRFYTACLPLTWYGGPFAAAREQVAAGRLGRVEAVHFTYLARQGPRFITTTPHFRDPDVPLPALSGGEAAMFSGYGVVAIEALSGSTITTVSASCGGAWYPSYRELGCEDLAHAVVTTVDGATGTITVGRTPDPRPGAQVMLEVIGSSGYYDYRSERDGAPEPNGVAAFVADVVAAVRDEREPELNSSRVLATAGVLAALYRSNHCGEPVTVERLRT